MPSIQDLTYEILDTVFSFFSSSSLGGGRSYWEDQQDLLALTQVNRQFNRVARVHLARFIPIASLTKARQILRLCDTEPSFRFRLQSLLLVWPDQGKYQTRRANVTDKETAVGLLCAFPAMRQLELICLPFPDLDEDNESNGINFTLLSSAGALANLRSLNLSSSPYTKRNCDYPSVASLLKLCPLLDELKVYNMPISSALARDETGMLLLQESPSCKLKSLSLRYTHCKLVDNATLSWVLKSTIASGSLRNLLIHLGTSLVEHDNASSKAFEALDRIFTPGLQHLLSLSLSGLPAGQASSILAATTSKLRTVELHGVSGYSSSILSDLPSPVGQHTGVKVLRLPLLLPRYGAPDEPDDHPELPISSSAFLTEIMQGGKLENLKELVLPGDARFGKRGKWYNNHVQKACRKRGIKVVEDPPSRPKPVIQESPNEDPVPPANTLRPQVS
ncbi:hypothetical protein EMMF5_003129 [Cystobasidiomycetes sp. EMM_F5]